MPLQGQTVPIVLGKLDALSDPRTTPTARLIDVQNFYRERTGELVKRGGRTAVGGSTYFTYSARPLGALWQLGAYKNTLVPLGANMQTPASVSGPQVCSISQLDASDDKLTTVYDALKSYQTGPITTTRRAVCVDDNVNACPDMAVDVTNRRYGLTAWEQGSNIVAVVDDLVSGERIVTKTYSGGVRPRCYAVGTKLVMVHWVTATGYFQVTQWSTSSLGTSPTESQFAAADIDRFDIVILIETAPTILQIFAHDSAATNCKLYQFDLNTAAVTTTAIAEDADRAIGILKDYGNSGRLFLATIGSANGARVRVVNASTAAVLRTDTIDAAAAVKAYGRNIVGHSTSSSTTGYYVCLYEQGVDYVGPPPQRAYETLIKVAKYTALHGLWTGQVLVRGMGLRSKTFFMRSAWTGQATSPYAYYVGAYPMDITLNQLQGTYFLMPCPLATDSGVGDDPTIWAPGDIRNAPVAKMLPWVANGLTEKDSTCANVQETGSHGSPNVCYTAVTRQTARLITGGNVAGTRVGIDAFQFLADGDNTAIGKPKEAADLMLVNAGQVLAFDSQQFSEFNFPLYPEKPTKVTDATAAGGLVPDSTTFSYVAVYRRTDAQGRIHRSTPSLPVSITTTAGTGANNHTLTVQTTALRTLGSQPLITGGADVVIEFYRSLPASNPLYYLVGTVANNPVTDFITFADTFAQASIDGSTDPTTASTLLYTTGNVLSSDSPPQLRDLTIVRSRMFGVSADFPQIIYHTQVMQPGLPPAFNAALTISVEDDRGDITALACMDEKLIIFKRTAIYVVAADGPDALGRGTYPVPQRISVEIGALRPRAVCETPIGLIFQSAKGIWLLNRALSLEFIGADLHDLFNVETDVVIDCVHVDALNQVRVFAQSGKAYVYNYFFKEWTTFTGQTTLGAVKYGTKVAQLNPYDYLTGVIDADSGAWTDPISSGNYGAYTCRLITSWISPGQLAGFGKLWEILIAGKQVGGNIAEAVTVKLYTDLLDATVVETTSLTGLSNIAPFLFSYKPSVQSLSAFKLEIISAAVATEEWRFSGLAMHIGVDARLWRLASTLRLH